MFLIFLPFLCNYRKSTFAINALTFFCFDPLIVIASRIVATKKVRAIVHNGNSGIDGEVEGLGLDVVVGLELAEGVGDEEV